MKAIVIDVAPSGSEDGLGRIEPRQSQQVVNNGRRYCWGHLSKETLRVSIMVIPLFLNLFQVIYGFNYERPQKLEIAFLACNLFSSGIAPIFVYAACENKPVAYKVANYICGLGSLAFSSAALASGYVISGSVAFVSGVFPIAITALGKIEH